MWLAPDGAEVTMRPTIRTHWGHLAIDADSGLDVVLPTNVTHVGWAANALVRAIQHWHLGDELEELDVLARDALYAVFSGRTPPRCRAARRDVHAQRPV